MNKETFLRILLLPLLISCHSPDRAGACSSKWEVYSLSDYEAYRTRFDYKENDNGSFGSPFFDYKPYSVFDGYEIELAVSGVCCHWGEHREKYKRCDAYIVGAEVIFANNPVSSFLVYVNGSPLGTDLNEFIPSSVSKGLHSGCYCGDSEEAYFQNIPFQPTSLGRFIRSAYYEDANLGDFSYTIQNAKGIELASVYFSQGMEEGKRDEIASGVFEAIKDNNAKASW